MNKMDTVQILAHFGIQELNEMQKQALHEIPRVENSILLSPTGSGKTLAFLLPIYEILLSDVRTVQCLIVVPTRELGLQIEQVWKKMGTGFKSNVCYGGHSIETEIQNLSNPPALLIGTPFRLVDHLNRESFDTSCLTTLVLDEFDKSLQMGFQDEMMHIVNHLPNISKRILISATSDIKIPAFTQVVKPLLLDYTQSDEPNQALTLRLIVSPLENKMSTLFQLICSIQSEPAIIFCNLREDTEQVVYKLRAQGILIDYYHGGMEQEDRERVLTRFRNGSLRYLASTDLAARGLDIPHVKHVIHFQLPLRESEFMHRNGRTARMHSEGSAYILLSNDECAPEYLPSSIRREILTNDFTLPEAPVYVTIYISGGKKNKLNKVDIVGFFVQKGCIEKSEIGLIEVKDFSSFVAIQSSKVDVLLKNIKDQKMKGKKYKIEVADL